LNANSPRWWPLVVGTVVLAVLGFYVQAKLVVRNGITDFLPEGRDRSASVVSREIAESSLARTMILSIEGPDSPAAAAGAKALAALLAKNPDVAWIRGGVGPDVQAATYSMYFPRRWDFASDRPDDELPARLSNDGLREAARALKRALGSPLGPLVRRLAPDDPLLLFTGELSRLRAAQDDSLHLEDDQFVSADGTHGILFLETRAAPFDGPAQMRLLSSVDAAFAQVNHDAGGSLRLESSGVNRFNVAVEKTVRADIQRISVVSTVGVVVLFLLIFRSVRYVALGLIPLVAGTICAMAAGIAIFGSLHGLTLAFGSSLIGVGIDYAEHYFSHYTVSPDPAGPEASLMRIWPGLVVGAITTVAGLAGLAWTSFPALREIAVFSTVGVVAALLSTRWFLPPLMPRRPKPVRLQQRLAHLFGRGMVAMMRARRSLLILPLAGVAICAIGLPRIRWVDDMSALSAIDSALLAEDLRVRERVAKADPGRFVVVVGESDDDALAKNDDVAARLDDAKRSGILDGYSSVHSLVWASALQRRSHDGLANDPLLPARVASAFAAEGFVASALHPFAESTAGPAPGPLTLDDLLHSPLADLVRPFRVVIDGKVALITLLGGVHDVGALRARLDGRNGVLFLDQKSFVDEAYARFRSRTLEMIGVGLVVVFLIVHARYRRLRLSLAAFLPAILAVAVSLAFLALLGQPLNLLHLVGVLLVLSMGADYGIFVVESRNEPEELGATFVSLVVAMLSTVLSFGLLGMSSNPALAALGITAGLGTLLSVVFAPAALVLLHTSEDAR
jgi:predicted exporter